MPHADLVTVPPSPAINYTLQQEDTTVLKRSSSIFCVYAQVPNNENWKIDITPVISARNWNFHWSEVDIVVKLLVITLT